ncbi:MAG: hypothetical protein JW729_03725 [Bacteroidales bacterium]|nr:hypothetical protein [Bacteroidales bacterium]
MERIHMAFTTFVQLKKINLKDLVKISFLLVLLGFFSACLKNEICSPVLIEPVAGIYTVTENNGLYDTVLTMKNIDSLYSLSYSSENILYQKDQINSFNLPLNNVENQSGFVLSIDGIKDTIYLNYEKALFFYSVKCGATYTYTITNISYTTNSIKEILLINPAVNVVTAENIQLVF